MTPSTAVILAAGFGSRLQARTRTRHKALLPVGDTSLIERSIAQLHASAVERIVVGVGYRSEDFEPLARGDSRIDLVPCPDYATTSSLASLYAMRDHVHDDFLLLESDLLYEQRALDAVLAEPQRDVVLASSVTQLGDEVFIETNDEGQLVGVSKNRRALGRINGVLVGINKISAPTFRRLIPGMFERLRRAPQTHYEQMLALAGSTCPFFVRHERALVWTEVDNEAHYAFATRDVYPAIVRQERDGSTSGWSP